MSTLHIGAHVATHDGMVDLRDGVPVHFATQGGERTLEDACEKAAFAVLGSAWPATLAFPALLQRIHDVSPRTPDADALGAFLLDAYARAAIELWTCPPRCVAATSDRPVGSMLARRQVADGLQRVSTLRNETVELGDDLGRAVLSLLDGTRDRRSVLDTLVGAVLEGGSTMELEGRPVTEAEEVRAVLAGRLDDALDELAENALLIG